MTELNKKSEIRDTEHSINNRKLRLFLESQAVEIDKWELEQQKRGT